MLPRETAPKVRPTGSHFLTSVTCTPGRATSYYCVLSFTWGLYKYLSNSHVRDIEGPGALPSSAEDKGQQIELLSFRTKYSSIIRDGSLPTAGKPCRALEEG